MLPEEEKRRIHLALDAWGGDRTQAAAALEMTVEELKDKIHNCKELKLKWSNSSVKQLSPATVLDRERIGDGAFVEPVIDIKAVQSLQHENGKFKEGLALLGLNPNEMTFAESLQTFQKKHFRHITDVIGGGASVASMKLSYSMVQMVDRLNNGQAVKDSDSWEIVLMMCAELRKLGEMVNDLIIKQALVELRRKENQNGVGPKGKPGFGQLQKTEVHVNAAPGSKVEIKEASNGPRQIQAGSG